MDKILVIDDVGDLYGDIKGLLYEDKVIKVFHSKSNAEDFKKNMSYGYYFIIINYQYIDIDKFKSIDEYYGLYRCSQIIKFLSNSIYEVVKEYGSFDDFIAYVDGDDFVIIFNDYETPKLVGDRIIEVFDSNIGDFYDEEDRARNYISLLK